MGSATINRFEWLKAVMQSEGLNAGAKLVASAMAVQFANDETGQLNPSLRTLAGYVKASSDTVKRSVKALVEGGWLARTEGRGRGNKTTYRLASPGKIISLAHPEKGAKSPNIKGGKSAPLPKEKGANLRGKGGKSAPSYIEQSIEQKDRPFAAFQNHRFNGSPFNGPTYIPQKDWNRLNPWADWLADHGFPKLIDIPISAAGSKPGTSVFALPYSQPPKNPDQTAEAIAYFTAMNDAKEVRHAAQ